MSVNSRCEKSEKMKEILLNEVQKFTYLEIMVSKDSGSDIDMKSKNGEGEGSFHLSVSRSKLIGRKTKHRIFNTDVKQILFYGSET